MKINGVKITVSALAAEIHDCGQYLKRNFAKGELREDPRDSDSFEGTDARLCVHGGYWQLLTGDSSYDQDHRGSWGTSCIPRACTWKQARETARELLNDCANDAATNGSEDEDESE